VLTRPSEIRKASGPTQTGIPPLLRWAGSKRKLLHVLSQYCPSTFGKYIEPFAGSACLFFFLRPDEAVLGDFNPSLIETYGSVARAPHAIFQRLSGFPQTDEFYYRLRAVKPATLKPLDRAARFVYLNRFCFNGVFRTNLNGDFNVPKGTRTGVLPTDQELSMNAAALRKAHLIAGDFEKTIETAVAGDLVYLDPPYSLSEDRNRGEYGYGAFSSDDLPRLETTLKALDQKNAHFLLSYRCSKLVRERFGCWQQRTLTVRRHVAGFSEDRRNVREMLISNRPFPAGHKG
jgi:DNA adenine methylase